MAGSDVLTVVVTDIVGSTALRHEFRDDRADALLARHDTIVVDSVAAHDGRVVTRTWAGATVCFGSARGAIECAVAIQRALHRLRGQADAVPEVRIGIDAGEVLVSEDGDLSGRAVDVAAGLATEGTGGDILVSDVVTSLVGAEAEFGFVLIGERLGARPRRALPVPRRAVAVRRTRT